MILNFFKWLWHLVPIKFRSNIAKLRFVMHGGAVILEPTYAEDGLISQHITPFMADKKFLDSYNKGKKLGALDGHPSDIHFRAYIACWASKYALNLDGDFLECGVGKALLSKTIVEYLDFKTIQKKFYLFDTYQGIPCDVGINDVENNNIEFLNKAHFNEDYYHKVSQFFKGYDNVILCKGRIPDSFDGVPIQRLAYISIDMNNATAEMAAINYLWEFLVVGGVIVLDDYAYGVEFLAQKEAWDNFAKKIGTPILTLPTGQGLLFKQVNT